MENGVDWEHRALTEDAADVVSCLAQHYSRFWGKPKDLFEPPERNTRVEPLPASFRILKFRSGSKRCWIYATAGVGPPAPVELHLMSPVEDDHTYVESLSAVAHYHIFGRTLQLGDSVNLGRPWLPDASCSHCLLSLPYLDGPDLEVCNTAELTIRCLWLIPVTVQELEFRREFGTNALEERFEASAFNYLNPTRPSVI